jgi:diguanylate cyclase
MVSTAELRDGVLHLNARPGHTAPRLRDLLDEALAQLHDLITATEGGKYDGLCAEIRACRELLSGEPGPTALDQISWRCLDACREVIDAINAEQAERCEELTNLISMVREAAATVASGGEALTDSVQTSAGRLEALSRMNDLTLIKSRLATEVTTLRRVTAERRTSWQKALGTLRERVASLEGQLASSQREATVDPLTGLANRRGFDAALDEAIHSPLARCVLAFIDVDAFKSINDTLGHDIGDHVLTTVARTIGTAVRDIDRVGRYGGDEFIVLLRDVTLQQAEARLREVVRTLAALAFTASGQAFNVTASCGAAELCAGDTAVTLTKRADEALYEAKRRGKNRVATRDMPYVRDFARR